MLGLEVSIEQAVFQGDREKVSGFELICTVTVLGFAVPANFCNLLKEFDELDRAAQQESTEELESKETTNLQVHNNPFTAAGLTKFDFESGLVVSKTFWEMTFISIQIRFVIWVECDPMTALRL